MIKVSVIVPIYNSEKHLRYCLDSLVNQSLEEIEIIAIDDASTDNSFSILKEYEKQFPNKLKVFQNSSTLGAGSTRNRGIKLATGKYIGFVDSDDYVSFDMYKIMYQEATSNNYPEVISSGLIFVKDNYYLETNFKDIFSRKGMVISPLTDSEFILNQSPSACNKIFRSDTVKTNLFLEGVMWEDVAFTYAKMFNAKQILSFNAPMYFYRRTTEGVSGKGYVINSNLLDIFVIADTLANEVKSHGNYEKFQTEIKFIQITTCLQRVMEIMNWPIELKNIDELCTLMSLIIIHKYGDWRNIPVEELTTKVGLLELERINDLINKIHIPSNDISSLEEQIKNNLTSLK